MTSVCCVQPVRGREVRIERRYGAAHRTTCGRAAAPRARCMLHAMPWCADVGPHRDWSSDEHELSPLPSSPPHSRSHAAMRGS